MIKPIEILEIKPFEILFKFSNKEVRVLNVDGVIDRNNMNVEIENLFSPEFVYFNSEKKRE
jgi:hypothetical protein